MNSGKFSYSFVSLFFGILEFNEEIFKLLVKNGVNLEKVDDSGRTPL